MNDIYINLFNAFSNPVNLIGIMAPFFVHALIRVISRYMYFSKKGMWLVTVLLFVGSLVLSSYCLNNNALYQFNLQLSIKMALAICFLSLLGGYPILELSFKQGISKDKLEFKNSLKPKKNPSNVMYYEKKPMVYLIAFVGRWSLCLTAICFILGILYYNISLKPGENYDFLDFQDPSAIFFAIYLFTHGFLRIFVKCQNCHLDIYLIDQNIYSFQYIATRVLKDNVLECWHCQSAFALEPEIDLNKLRDENIKNWENRKEIKQELES